MLVHHALLAALLLQPGASVQPPEPGLAEVAAIEQELVRGIAKLRLDDSPTPFLAVARVMRWELISLDGSYGGLITDVHEKQAVGTVEVRVGTAKRDQSSMFGQDGAQMRFALPLKPNAAFTRQRMWLAMDQAFRSATGTYAQKQAILGRLAGDPPPPDLSPRTGTIPRDQDLQAPHPLGANRDGLRKLTKQLSARFAQHPEIDNGDVYIQILSTDMLTVDNEGMVLHDRGVRAVLAVTAQTRAPDGMLLDHAGVLHSQAPLVPGPELQKRGEELVERVLSELEVMAKAPMLDEDYDGPLLFSEPAAAGLLASTVATQAAGTPPPFAGGGRLLEMEPLWQASLGKSVLPPSFQLVDDPEKSGFGGYKVDAEGTAATRTVLVKDGVLKGQLMTRTPNKHLAVSTGRARISPVLQVGATISNLSLTNKKRGKSQRALETELLKRAREDGYEFAYIVEALREGNALGPVPRDGAIGIGGGRKVSLPLPAKVYRLDADGTRTLVRGAMFSPVSMRVLRRIRASGRKSATVPMRIVVGPQGGLAAEPGVEGILSHTVDVEVSTPALLIDGFELLVERGEHERLPTLVHPLRNPEWKPPSRP
ncbi:MAG: metallopeptidase TldD-related protein [Nannocystaceae bacterium]